MRDSSVMRGLMLGGVLLVIGLLMVVEGRPM